MNRKSQLKFSKKTLKVITFSQIFPFEKQKTHVYEIYLQKRSIFTVYPGGLFEIC